MLHGVRSQVKGSRLALKDLGEVAGNVFFVDSINGTDAVGFGRSPGASALASFAHLITNATTLELAAGDTVILGVGHNEGIADAQIAVATANLHVIGHPDAVGALIPTFDFDHANAEITVDADDCLFKHIRLRPSVPAVLVGIEVSTDVTGTKFEDVKLAIGEDGSGADEFVKGIRLVSGNDDTELHDVEMLAHGSAGAATHGIHIDAASDRLVFDNVVIDGPWATGGIVEDAAGVNHVMVDCSVDTSGTNYSFNGSSTFAKRVGNLDGGAADSTAASEGIGSRFVTTSAVTSSAIPNNTQTAGAITGASAGTLVLHEIIVQTGVTGWVAPTNIEWSVDNASGVTGAAAPIMVDAVASLGGNVTVSSKDATSHTLPLVLESGKKVFIHGDNAAGTGAGIGNVYLVWERVTAGATVAGSDLP